MLSDLYFPDLDPASGPKKNVSNLDGKLRDVLAEAAQHKLFHLHELGAPTLTLLQHIIISSNSSF